MSRHSFTATIHKVGILRSVVVPADIVITLGSTTRIPVIAGNLVDATPTTLVPAGREPGAPELPPDILRAEQFRAAAAELDRASRSTYRSMVRLLEQARTPDPRHRHMGKLVERRSEMATSRNGKRSTAKATRE
jgi:ornithine cyclodeaminase/alanine dehydrogenase-like protein (mu-crystallin family)